MKTLRSFILLMAVLCLAGCSGEDPQRVDILSSLSINGYTQLNIDANCTWTITDKRGACTFIPSSGNGPAEIEAHVPYNDTYEDITYVFVLTSEDGTSSDTYSCTQEGREGFLIEFPEIFSAEGGTYEIPAKTNSEILSINLPDWMKLISTRAMKDYVYTFTVLPNTSGSIRKDEVSFDTFRFEVNQDSYTPVSIVPESIPPFVIGNHLTGNSYFSLNFQLEPAYADPSKITITCSDEYELRRSDFGGYVLMSTLSGFGKHNFSLSVGDSQLLQANTESVPSEPFKGNWEYDAYLGQKSGIADWTYYSSLYTLKSSDISVIKVVDNNHFEAVGIGTAVITAEIPGFSVHSERPVHVEHFILDAWVYQLSQCEDGSYNVVLAAKVKGPENMKILSTGLKYSGENTNHTFLSPEFNASDQSFLLKTQTLNVNFDRKKYSSIDDYLLEHHAYVKVSIGENEYEQSHYMRRYEEPTD